MNDRADEREWRAPASMRLLRATDSSGFRRSSSALVLPRARTGDGLHDARDHRLLEDEREAV